MESEAVDQTEKKDWSKFITTIGGNPHLAVKYRVAMLREAHPDAEISTELIEHTEAKKGTAVFKASVDIPGGGSATGWGSETFDDFRDYLEKAETKALGRALANLGYGTLEAGEEDPTLARGSNQRNQNRNERVQERRAEAVREIEEKATPEQISEIEAWRVREGVSKQDIREIIKYVVKKEAEKLRKGDAETVLFALKNHPIEELYGWKK